MRRGLLGRLRRAEAIVAHRERVGDFRNDDELSQVIGIRPHVLSAKKRGFLMPPVCAQQLRIAGP